MYSDSMEILEEAKDFIRFLYAQVQEKNSREEMLMQEIASQKRLVCQKEKDTDTINRLLSNIERLMHELSEARAEISRLVSVNSSLVEQISILKKQCYGSPSQRNR
jgi:predicted RNase H-like nuclease (RuvC/YqgF family)